MKIQHVELEITSDCNARCPGCTRTIQLGNYTVQDFTLDDLRRMFPTKMVHNTTFKFCGILGDPIVNPDMLKMIEYIGQRGGRCVVSTNGGRQPVAWWQKLGQLARDYDVKIHFCIDGHAETNHIYRIGTVFKTIIRNVMAFQSCAPAGAGRWVYLLFDHNEHELEIARAHALEMGLEFYTRTGASNSMKKVAVQPVKETRTYTVTSSGRNEHQGIEDVRRLDNFHERLQRGKVDQIETQEVVDSIECDYYHKGNLFVGADQTLWPCCYLYDSMVYNRDGIRDKLSKYGTEWNSLRLHSVEEILKHPWYQIYLRESWDPHDDIHLARCIKQCGANAAARNKLYKE